VVDDAIQRCKLEITIKELDLCHQQALSFSHRKNSQESLDIGEQWTTDADVQSMDKRV
jgi:hypothetical protein